MRLYLDFGLSFFALILLNFFLKINISGVEQGSYNLLFLNIFVLLAILFLKRASTTKRILICCSKFFLFIFLAYLILRIVVDINKMNRLQALTLGTTGGLILFYILGVLVANIIGLHEKNTHEVKNYFIKFALFFIGYLMVNCVFLLNIFFEQSANLRLDIFLIENKEGYQRKGNFLSISYLILITLYARLISLRSERAPCFLISLYSSISFSLFIICTLTSLVVALMIGSLNALVLITVLGGLVITLLILLWINSVRKYLTFIPLTFTRLIFSKLSLFFIVFGILVFAMLSGVILLLINFLSFDLNSTRLLNFGNMNFFPSSLSERISIISEFHIQFKYSPFFGNMNVDCITSGCGRYMHSVFASLLTHTGLLGFFLFAFYLVLAHRERFKINKSRLRGGSFLTKNIYNMFTVLFFLAILLLGSLMTFFNWITLWFALGLIFTEVELKD